MCLCEVNQPLAKFATGRNLSRVGNDVKFWLLRIYCKRILNGTTATWVKKDSFQCCRPLARIKADEIGPDDFCNNQWTVMFLSVQL